MSLPLIRVRPATPIPAPQLIGGCRSSAPSKKTPNPIDIHVGSRVRLRRMMLGMSQKKLGEHLGVTFQQVQKYENGTTRIGASRLQAIARMLSVPVAFFFEDAPGGGDGHEPMPTVDITFDAATLEITRLVQAMTPTQRQSVRQIARAVVEAAGGEIGGAA